MAQTPQQRRANAQFAKSEEAKRGKPQAAVKAKSKPEKSPISPMWLYLLLFVVCGGIIFEIVRVVFSGASSFF